MRARYTSHKLVCSWCGDPFKCVRADAKTCGLKCRVAKNRALVKEYAEWAARYPKDAAKQKVRPKGK